MCNFLQYSQKCQTFHIVSVPEKVEKYKYDVSYGIFFNFQLIQMEKCTNNTCYPGISHHYKIYYITIILVMTAQKPVLLC
jgi:hypothetical protein